MRFVYVIYLGKNLLQTLYGARLSLLMNTCCAKQPQEMKVFSFWFVLLQRDLC